MGGWEGGGRASFLRGTGIGAATGSRSLWSTSREAGELYQRAGANGRDGTGSTGRAYSEELIPRERTDGRHFQPMAQKCTPDCSVVGFNPVHRRPTQSMGLSGTGIIAPRRVEAEETRVKGERDASKSCPGEIGRTIDIWTAEIGGLRTSGSVRKYSERIDVAKFGSLTNRIGPSCRHG